MSQIIRYANDLQLTELARGVTNLTASLNHDLRDGYLDAAFLKACRMETKLVKLMERLNDLKYHREA